MTRSEQLAQEVSALGPDADAVDKWMAIGRWTEAYRNEHEDHTLRGKVNSLEDVTTALNMIAYYATQGEAMRRMYGTSEEHIEYRRRLRIITRDLNKMRKAMHAYATHTCEWNSQDICRICGCDGRA